MPLAAVVDLEAALRRVVVGYRAAGVAWMALLAVAGDLPPGLAARAVAGGVIAGAGLWTLLTALVARSRPALFASWAWIAADTAVAAATVLAPLGIAAVAAADAGGVAPFAGGYPFAAVLLAAWARGLPGGLAVAASLSVATVYRQLPAGAWTLDETLPSALVYLAGAAVTAWGVGLLRRHDEERRSALLALAEQRAATARERERAETAAHLHDSVLQTLALIQRRAGDAAAVRGLARDQERELRDWLSGTASSPRAAAALLRERCAEVERSLGVPVEVVVTGDRAVDEAMAALVAAAAEAVRNAARHSGAEAVSVYAELAGAPVVFVRDRGCGFDPDAVPADRRGIAESVRGRLERHDGQAILHTGPGRGTEWELRLSPDEA